MTPAMPPRPLRWPPRSAPVRRPLPKLSSPQRAPATSTGMAAAERQAAGPAPKDAPAAPGSKAQAEAAPPLEYLLRFLQLRAQVCSTICECEGMCAQIQI